MVHRLYQGVDIKPGQSASRQRRQNRACRSGCKGAK
jgi:hypothetical protein